jgi:hypothetical protein
VGGLVVLEVTRVVRIDAGADLVRAQFADVEHHARSVVHRGTTFEVVSRDAAITTYEQISQQGPIRLRQRFELDASNLAHQVNTVTAGPFTGGTLTFEITDHGPSTMVRATLRAPGAASRLAAPVLRATLGRTLARALKEDKVDLESGHYPTPTS